MSLRRRSIIYSNPPPSIIFTDNAQVELGGGSGHVSSRTFSGINFGDPHPSRLIVVGLGTQQQNDTGTAGQNTMTIGGVSATRLVNTSMSSFNFAMLYVAAVPTGTSGSIVATNNAQEYGGRIGIGVWAAYNCTSASPVDTAQSLAAGTQNLTLSGPDNGAYVAFSWASVTSQPSWNWSGLTQRFSASPGGGAFYWGTGADKTGSRPSSIGIAGFGFSVAASFK